MKVQYREFPENWGYDELTKFIDNANSNVVATFSRNIKEYPQLSEIDNIFVTIIDALINPKSIIESILLMRSHATYRATTLLAMSGMNPEAFVQIRSCLESSLYAHHMYINPGLDRVWLERHNDESALKQTKREFTFSRIIQSLESQDNSISKVARELYERSINYGAHPNERYVTANLKMFHDNSKQRIQQSYLEGGTITQQHSMKSTAQAGLCTLYIYRLIFRERFDILGLTERMESQRDVL